MKSLKLIFGFIMGLCLTATMTSCDDDEDNGVSVPQEVLSAMPGTYVNSMEYGEATADSAMTVTLGTADMQFNLPVSNIIKDVVAAEKPRAGAQHIQGRHMQRKLQNKRICQQHCKHDSRQLHLQL